MSDRTVERVLGAIQQQDVQDQVRLLKWLYGSVHRRLPAQLMSVSRVLLWGRFNQLFKLLSKADKRILIQRMHEMPHIPSRKLLKMWPLFVSLVQELDKDDHQLLLVNLSLSLDHLPPHTCSPMSRLDIFVTDRQIAEMRNARHPIDPSLVNKSD